MTIPMTCLPVADQISELEAERADLQAELQQAPPGRKAFLATQIKALNRRIQALQDQLADCLRGTPGPPGPPPPLQVEFTGTATVRTTNPYAPGPYVSAVSLVLVFDSNRTSFGIADFPAITSAPFATPLGSNVTTIRRIEPRTSGIYATGAIVVALALRFDHSVTPDFLDSDLTVLLTTAPPGAPVDSVGAVTLTGGGPFTGGFLGGSFGTLTIAGTLTPVP